MNHLLNLIRNASRRQIVLSGGILIIVLVYFFFFTGSEPKRTLVQVERGTVTQELKVTGVTKPLESVTLAFEESGKITGVTVAVGSRVGAGQTLAYLNQGQLLAQLAQQQAAVQSEEAKLEEMQKGSRPEEVSIKQAALNKANQDLTNEYQSVANVLNDAYIKADNAIRNDLDNLFTNDEAINVKLSFVSNNSQLTSNLENDRHTASGYLNIWKKELENMSNDQATVDTALLKSTTYLSFFRTFIADLSTALDAAPNLVAATIASYKSSVATARTDANTALTNVNGAAQDIAAQKLVVKQSEADLNQVLAGNTPESIKSQTAKLKEAEARVQGTQAQIEKIILRAPFSGVVTKQDAKVGEIASPNTPVISLISEGKLEIEANISEVDVGKVAVGNPTSITIDAFPGETFTGKVSYVDPAETVVDGVTNFKTKIVFDTKDTRLKSGLTVNLTIETLKKEGVLTLPQFTLIEKDGKTYVEKTIGETITSTLVTIGIRGQGGVVEILSGVSEGESVLGETETP